MSIRILTLATAAATTLEGSIVRRQVRHIGALSTLAECRLCLQYRPN
jgi:hypothetical protein